MLQVCLGLGSGAVKVQCQRGHRARLADHRYEERGLLLWSQRQVEPRRGSGKSGRPAA